MKRIIFFTSCIFLFSIVQAQPSTKANSRPGINEFAFADKEPEALNITDIRQAIGYPPEAVEKEVSGYVVARILVDKKGNYVEHKIIKQVDPSLGKAVEAHLSEIKFKPAINKGKPIPFWVNIPFHFQLKSGTEERQEITIINMINEKIEESPEDYELYLKRGIQYKNLEDHEKATADFEKSISLNPQKNKRKTSSYPYLFYAYLGMGKSQMALSKWEEATESFTKAISFSAASKNRDTSMIQSIPTAYVERGIVLGKQNKYPEASSDYDWVIENSEENRCLVYSLKYDLSLSQNDFPVVINCLNEVIKCEPENETLFFNRGYYKIKTKEYESAIEDFDRILNANQNYLLRIAALNRKGICYREMGQLDKALEAIDKARNINVLHPQAYYLKGTVLLKKGESEEACKALNKAISFGLEGDEKEEADKLLVNYCQ